LCFKTDIGHRVPVLIIYSFLSSITFSFASSGETFFAFGAGFSPGFGFLKVFGLLPGFVPGFVVGLVFGFVGATAGFCSPTSFFTFEPANLPPVV
jgi:hypothetical protein